jgi:hypothetical protein
VQGWPDNTHDTSGNTEKISHLYLLITEVGVKRRSNP